MAPGALMSVSGRNRDVLISSAVSAAAGVVLVAGAAQFGIVWCAIALTVKNAGIVLWLVWWLDDQVKEPLKIYFWTLVAPFSLMLAGIGMGVWIVGPGPQGETAFMQLFRLGLSLIPGAVVTIGWFSMFFWAEVRDYCAALRHRS